MLPDNARSSNVELIVDEDKLAMPEFKALWNKINKKSAYVVDFDTDELIQKAIVALDSKLRVPKIYFKVETGVMEEIESKEMLAAGTAFLKNESDSYAATVAASSNVKYDTDIFTEPSIKGKLGVNAMKTNKHLYDHIIYDSSNEQTFAKELDTCNDVAVYVKLPKGFYISTPVGHYNPDWAIAFREGKVKHVYFVAETKGSMSSMQLRLIEESKIHCAREHFKAISSENIIYDVVDSYKSLMDKVMK